MTTPKIDHLIFSTRAADPESGTESNREIIAWSRGVSDKARRAFADRGDFTISATLRRELPPIYACSKIDDETWLFCRAISLRVYRKSSHQMLIHGVVLTQDHLDWLGGNPFLLDHPEIRATGFEFHEKHPDGQQELEPLGLDPTVAELAPRLNQERFDQLRQELSEHDDGFPALFELLLRSGRRTACILPGQPDPRLVQWLLLHLHPHDRLEVSFHTWYTHDRPVDYRLMLGTEADLTRLRQQFRDLDLWPDSAMGISPDALGSLTYQLRETASTRFLEGRPSEVYGEVIGVYQLTYFARRDLNPLSAERARICLRYELGLSLTPAEEQERQHLARRGEAGLEYYVHDLAREWDRAFPGFTAHLESLRASRWRFGAEAVDELLPKLPDSALAQRWASAVLLLNNLAPSAGDGQDGVREVGETARQGDILQAWYRLVPPQRFTALLEFFADEEQVAHAVPYLSAHVELAARHQARTAGRGAGAAGGTATPDYWPVLLPWLAARGRGLAGFAARIEGIADAATDPLAVDWYRRLETLCFATGASIFAYRLIFQKEVPRLHVEGFRERVQQAVGSLLGSDEQSADAVLRPFLSQPRLAAEVVTAMADWLCRREDPETGWRRWTQLLASQGQALCPEISAAGGELLARLAISRLQHRVGEALQRLVAGLLPTGDPDLFADALLSAAARRLTELAQGGEHPALSPHLPGGIAHLVAARLGHPASEPVDEKLLVLLLHGIVHADHAADRRARGSLPAAGLPGYPRALRELRQRLWEYLVRLQDLGRFDRLVAGPWCDLLFDELLSRPPENVAVGPRYRACLRLAWRRWCDEREGKPWYEIRVQRLVIWDGTGPSIDWHREQLREALPAALYNEAEAMLAIIAHPRSAATPA